MNILNPHNYRFVRMGGVVVIFSLIIGYFAGLFTENALFIMLYVLFGAAIIALIGFLIHQLITNSAIVKQFVFAIAGLAFVVGLALLLSVTDSSTLLLKTTKKASSAALIMGSTVFYCIYIILGLAVVGILISEIRNLLKR